MQERRYSMAGKLQEDTVEKKKEVVQCISAFRDSERAERLIVPPARLAVTTERAKVLIEAGVCKKVK